MRKADVVVVKTVTTTVTERAALSAGDIAELIRQHTGLEGARVEFEVNEITGELEQATIERTRVSAQEV